jgi:tRNA (guanine-N7-)-methyltransferase
MDFFPTDYFCRLEKAEIFPDTSRDLELDVGCGDGTFLIRMAQHYPERDFLGIERLGGRVAKVVRKAKRLGLTNLKVLRLESSYALGWLLPKCSIRRIHLLFPDPWPKKRHAKNRFLTEGNSQAIYHLLEPGGEFWFKTDHKPYFDECSAGVDSLAIFSRKPFPSPEQEFYPITDFEQQWMDAGKPIYAARWAAEGKIPHPYYHT